MFLVESHLGYKAVNNLKGTFGTQPATAKEKDWLKYYGIILKIHCFAETMVTSYIYSYN